MVGGAFVAGWCWVGGGFEVVETKPKTETTTFIYIYIYIYINICRDKVIMKW